MLLALGTFAMVLDLFRKSTLKKEGQIQPIFAMNYSGKDYLFLFFEDFLTQ